MTRLISTLLATGVAATGAGLCTAARALDYVDAKDCFPTAAAVMAAHPDAAHVSWAKGTQPRCFFADRFRPGATPPQPAAQQQATQQPAAPAQPQAQQYGIFGIPLGIPAPSQPAEEQPQQAVQEPAVQTPPVRHRAARPLRQPAVAVAPAPKPASQSASHATTAAAVAPAPRAVAVPLADEAPAPQAAVQVPALPRVTTVTPLAARSAVVKDVPDDSAADFESRFSASGYHR